MKKIVCFLIIILLLSGCSNSDNKKISVVPIDTKTVFSLVDDENVYILDVREPLEYKNGHVKNAYNIPVQTIETIDMNLFPVDSKIIVYCQSGVRSRIAADSLIKMGYLNVYNMDGINAWEYELVSD